MAEKKVVITATDLESPELIVITGESSASAHPTQIPDAIWVLGGLVAFVAFLSLLLTVAGCPQRPQTEFGASTEAKAVNKGQLLLTAHTVEGMWEEQDVVANDTQSWNGSAGVVGRSGNRLYLLSNSHCLDLDGLSTADDVTDGTPEILRYALAVTFASGARREVLKFADQDGGLDLALLEVDGKGLAEGKDYVVLPYKTPQLEIGDEVVAVGSPFGLAGTHTFGRISALRPPSQEMPFRLIQTDAAINHGNSGGPLFVKRNNLYQWIGVNTMRIEKADNLGFAITATDAVTTSYTWYPSTPAGALKAIQDKQRQP